MTTSNAKRRKLGQNMGHGKFGNGVIDDKNKEKFVFKIDCNCCLRDIE